MKVGSEGASEQPFGSTRFEWRQVKVTAARQGTRQPRAQRVSSKRLPTWPRTKDSTLTIRWRGGAESWWLIQSRGHTYVVPGHLAIEDVMRTVLNER